MVQINSITNINNENTTDKAHSIFPPSSASRHLHCTPSFVMESMFPNETSEAAEEGTAAHALAEYKARIAFGYPVAERPVSEYDGEDLEDYTDMYVNLLKDIAARFNNPIVMLERVVHFDKFIPGGFGTADCIMISDDTLHIVDLKYGRVKVEAEDNDQMKVYAVGALQDFYAGFPNIKRVYVTVCQPRINNYETWSIDINDLYEWSNKILRPYGNMALAGAGELCKGSWCKYCKAKAFCSLKNKNALESISRLDLERKGNLMTPSEVAALLPIASEVSSWGSGLLDYAKKEAIENGTRWEGYKLIEGKKTRKFANTDAVVARAKEMGLEDGFVYSEPEVLSPSKLEKKVGKATFRDSFEELVSFSKPSLSLVPADDPHDEYIPEVKEEPKSA